jgi:hypothetical protein
MTVPRRVCLPAVLAMLVVASVFPTALVRAQSGALPKEVRALMPAKTGLVDGTWMVRPPTVRGEVSGELAAGKSCDANPPVVHISITINGVAGEHASTLLPKRKMGWDAEWTREKSTFGADAKVESTGGGEMISSQSERGCIQSPVASVTDSHVAAYVQKGLLAYTVRIGGPQPAAASRALALEVLANMQRSDLPLAAK